MFHFIYSSITFFQVVSIIYVIGIIIFHVVNKLFLKRSLDRKLIKLYDLALIVFILLTALKIVISIVLVILSLWKAIFYSAILVIWILLLYFFVKRYINTYKDEGYFRF